jgi:hypothetical protein
MFTGVAFFKSKGLDPDAQAFLTAAAITDATITSAVDNLVKGLKTNNLWSKMLVIYPVVGGSAAAHKFNLKDPRDLDAAFRLTFNGTWTHDSNGMVCTGSTSNWANTHILANTNLDRYSNHFAVYSTLTKTNINGYSGASSGSSSSLVAPYFVFAQRSFGSGGSGVIEFFSNSSTSLNLNGNTDVRGLNIGTRISDTELSLYRQKVRVATTSSVATGTPPANKIALNVIKTGTSTSSPDNTQYSFCSFGDGLTQTDVNNLWDVVDAFQGTLSRRGIPTAGQFPTTPV